MKTNSSNNKEEKLIKENVRFKSGGPSVMNESLASPSKKSEDMISSIFGSSTQITRIAEMYSQKKGFDAHYETSSLFGTNVKNVFDEAIHSCYQFRLAKFKEVNK